ncbi:MAG: CARDB domain-containing protein [Nanoarchaeota archaeon]
MKSRKTRLVVLTLELIILLALASFESSSILEKNWFYIDENISINIDELTNINVTVFNNASNFTLNKPSFSLNKTGSYLIKIWNRTTKETINITEFFVIEKPNNTELILDKTDYYIGEPIIILIKSPAQIKQLNITGTNNSYSFFGSIKSPLIFSPPKTGNYTITVLLTNNTKLTKKFHVDSESIKTISIKPDKPEYILGQTVTISLNFSKSGNYTFSISNQESIYYFLDFWDNTLQFVPKAPGKYYIELGKDSNLLGSSVFDVITKKQIFASDKLQTDKPVYELGEIVRIYVSGNITEFRILIDNELFTFLDILENTTFIPPKAGTYKIQAKLDNESIEYSFTVISRKKQLAFELKQDVIIDFDFAKEVESRKTAYDKLFNSQLIEQVTAYVDGQSENPVFNLLLSKLSENKFRVHIASDEKIEPGEYTLVITTIIKGKQILKKSTFTWFREENIPSKTISLEEIKEHIPYYFEISKAAVIDVDFGSIVTKERNILESALKKPAVEKISTYVYGQETNPDFVVLIKHLEYDKFQITINNNDNIAPDVYRLITIIMSQGNFYTKQSLYSWGISNITELTNKIKLKNITIPLKEVILTTQINSSDEKEHEPALNESMIIPHNLTDKAANTTNIGIENITNISSIHLPLENITKVNLTGLIPDITAIPADNLTINKTLNLINLSDKLISELIKDNITDINFTIRTDKKTYFVGEIIYVWSNANITRIQIYSQNGFFIYKELLESNMSFVPPSAGHYMMEAITEINNSLKVLAANFTVANASLNAKELSIQNISRNLIIKDYKGRYVNFTVRFIREKGITQQILAERLYDVLINIDSKEILFQNLGLQNLYLGFDEILSEKIAIKDKSVINAFAIDPSGLNFSNAVVSSVAQGKELWKCKDWNFSSQSCYGNWNKIMDISPDRTYNFSLTKYDPAFAEVFEIETSHLKVYREQSNGVGIGREMNVRFGIWNNNSVNMTNISLVDNFEDGWTISNPPSNSILGKRNIRFPINTIQKDELLIIEYKIRAPYNVTKSRFSSQIVAGDQIINISSQDIEVNASKAFFQSTFDLLEEDNITTRTMAINTTYKAYITIKNIGSKPVINYPTIYTWKYNESLWDITGADKSCKIIPFEGVHGLQCSWQPFMKNETKEFALYIKSPHASTQEYTKINITYDPPGKGSVVEKTGSFLSFILNKILDFLNMIWKELVKGGITGAAVGSLEPNLTVEPIPEIIIQEDEIILPEEPLIPDDAKPAKINLPQIQPVYVTIPIEEINSRGKKPEPPVETKVWITTLSNQFLRVRNISVPAGLELENRIKIKDSKNKEIIYKQKFDKIKKETYDLEFSFEDKNFKKVKLEKVNLKENQSLELGIDDVPNKKIQIKNKNPIKSYAIDPSRINFTNGSITAIAQGQELWKCKDWNFSEQKCYGDWKKIMELIPGTEYNIPIDRIDPAFTEIGLVTINTHKSIYLPDETAFIGIGILDHEGHMVCDANVTLVITDPSGTDTILTTMNDNISISPECDYYFVTNLPDYYTNYTVGDIGEYIMNITAVTYDGKPNRIDSFSVQSYVDFDVTRNGPTRIYPLVPYIMNFTIKANQDYYGDITEVVPIDFIITAQPGLTITEDNESISLSWNMNIISGNAYNIYYEFDAPDVSPEIFYLGPLTIDAWEETRIWQIASDAANGMLQDDYLNCDADSLAVGENTWCHGQYDETNDKPESWTVWLEDDTIAITRTCGASNFKVIDVDYTTSNSVCDSEADGIVTCLSWGRSVSNQQISWQIEACSLDASNTILTDAVCSTTGDDNMDASDTITMALPDTTPPTVSLDAPENNTWNTARNINFTFTPTTNDDFDYCSLWTNESGWSLKQTNTSTITDSTIHGINETFTTDGHFLWNIECYDTLVNSNFSLNNRTIKVDSTPPSISSLDYPPNTEAVGSSFVDFNFTPTDNMELANCTLWSNFSTSWQANKTILNPATGSENNITLNLIDGIYKWNIRCFDAAGNSDFYSSNYTVFVDTEAPYIFLESPENNSVWETSLTVEFEFNVSDLTDIINCSLILNRAYNKSNDTVISKDTSGQRITQILALGSYNWSINCTDEAGNSNASATYNFTVSQDIGAPTITIVYPENGSYINDNSVTLNISTNEEATCKYDDADPLFNFITEGSFMTDNGANSYGAVLGNLVQGNYEYYIKCNDSYNNTNNESNMGITNFTVDRTAPNVSLNLPIDLINYSVSDIYFNWTAFDSYIDDNLTCNLTIDGVINISNIASLNDTPTNVSVYMNNGTHFWNVTCWDDAGNKNSSGTRRITIDGDAPIIDIDSISANPATVSAGSPVTILANVTDSYYNVSKVFVNVSLQSAGTNYFYEMTYLGNNQYSYTFTDTSVVDIYNYKIWSNDTASPNSNSISSSSKSFTIAGILTIISVQTLNNSYKQDKIVNLSQHTENLSSDLETGEQTVIGYNNSRRKHYNFSNYLADGHRAYASQGVDSSPPGTGPNIAGEVAFTVAKYEAIDDSDNTYAGEKENDLRSHRFRFIITEDISLISKIELYWEGHDSGSTRAVLYIWDYNLGAWENLGEYTGSTDGTITYSKTSDLSDYINETNRFLDFAVVTDEPDSSDTFYTDYVYTAITTTNEIDGEGQSEFVDYTTIGNRNYTKISDMYIYVEVNYYNASGSVNALNVYPDLEIQLYDGSDYDFNYFCSLTSEYGSEGSYNYNCTKKVVNKTILSAWTNTNNRKIRVRGINMDGEPFYNDTINWTGIYVNINTPSKVENYGLINMSARLALTVQKYGESNWNLIEVLYNQSINISVNQTIDISSFWNTNNWSTNSRMLGKYRTYAAITDASGILLENQDGSYLNDSYEFNISYLKIIVESPLDSTTVDATEFWVNLTLNNTDYESSGWCVYSFDRQANITLQNDTAIHFYNHTGPITIGQHNITFYCNDTEGDISFETTIFDASDQTGPVINLEYPKEGADGLPNVINFEYNATDAVSNISNCSIYINLILVKTNLTVKEGISQYFNLTLENGTYDYRIDCYDNSSSKNLGQSAKYDFIVGDDRAPPEIRLGDPEDNYKTSNNDIVFYFGVYDKLADIANCSLIINNKINITKKGANLTESRNRDDNNFTFNNMPIGQYNWSINCTDTSSNANRDNSSTRNLTLIVDSDFPHITLLYPGNDAKLTSGTIAFQFNVTDASSGITNCTLMINNTANETLDVVFEGITQTITVVGLKQGYYLWNITCTDDSFQVNQNTSQTRNLTITILQNLNVVVNTDNTMYEQGTQAYEVINITTRIADQLGNPINGSSSTDIILGNTSLRWWNTAWARRKAIFLNETGGINRNEYLVTVNVTGLAGSITDCINEFRIIKNQSDYFTVIPCQIIGGDDSTWCSVAFKANISADAVDENNYYVYYNNSDALDPGYDTIVIEGTQIYNYSAYQTSGHKAYNSNNPSGGGPQPPNVGPVLQNEVEFSSQFYTNIKQSNNQYASSGDVNTEKSHRFVINTSGNVSDMKNLTFHWEGYTESQSTPTILYLWNYTEKSWDLFGRHSSTSDNTITNFTESAISDYINESSGLLHIAVVTGDPASTTIFYTDYIYATTTIDLNDDISRAGQEEVWVNRTIGETGSDGIFSFNISSFGLSIGWYSAVTFITSVNYNNATNYTNFQIIKDQTGPVVNLVSPENNNLTVFNNITFYYNATDTLSSIVNCSLMLNSTINKTNASITEGTSLNFSVYNMHNGNYLWTVNCSDNFSNYDAAPARTLIISMDYDLPKIYLISPPNNWTDTDSNITFFFKVVDQYTSTADCDLYINNTLNMSKNNLPTDGSTQSFIVNNSFHDGDYDWYINCTDDSLARFSNISVSRNFSVKYDNVPPHIKVISPAKTSQSTTGNVSFIFNVTDAISNITNCSVIINGTINQTNVTVNEGRTQNITVTGFVTGTYSWTIKCYDGSELKNTNVTYARNLTVGTDTDGPNINLEFPPKNAQLVDNTVVFRYNVSDFASGIANCSLIINNTINDTNYTVIEETSQNFTVVMPNGDYWWQVNCTDDSTWNNKAGSEKRNLTIGLDQTPPQITLEYPTNNGLVDSDGNITFLFRVTDIATSISNCSIILDNKFNRTNSTKIQESVPGQSFIVDNIANGSHTWNINCTDTASPPNIGNSTTWNFIVHLDNSPPVISLISPENNTLETDGDRIFYYNVTDHINGISNCSLILNNKRNQTNISTITEGETQSFNVIGLLPGMYNWSVNCTDTSDNKNKNSSEMRVLNVTIDVSAPKVSLISPSNNTLDTDGIRVFSYNVTDDISNISNCSLIFDGVVEQTNRSIIKGIRQNFTVITLTTRQYNWSINCTDASDNANTNSSEVRNLTVIKVTSGPFIYLESPANNTQDIDGNVSFIYNVSQQLSVANCSLIINNSINRTNASITRDVSLNFTLTMPPGHYLWNINCTDTSEDLFTNSSVVRFLVVGSDTDGPVINLEQPENNYLSTDNDVAFVYNVSDFASGVANCSLIINNTINQTNSSITEDLTLNFTIINLKNGDYSWSINCTDNSTGTNTANSSTRLLRVGTDVSPPIVRLESPLNNSRLTYTNNIILYYNVTDISSNIANCSLIINNRFNKSNASRIIESITLNFSISYLPTGQYNWSVNCTDTSESHNRGSSSTYNFSVRLPDVIVINVSTDAATYEEGSTVQISSNITNLESYPLSTSIVLDIIMGNATASWWNTSWRFRVPVEINSTNITRKDKLIEQQINFTDLLIDIGFGDQAFDQNSIRVIEWSDNISKEIFSQFDNSTRYNATSNAIGKVIWIMNSTTSSGFKRFYYIYFDTVSRPKSKPSYTQPTLSFTGSSKSVQYGGLSLNKDQLMLSYLGESLTLHFDEGTSLKNYKDHTLHPGSGGIWNITVNNTLLTNPNSTIAPFIVQQNDYLFANETTIVETGPVFTKISITGNISTIKPSYAQVNYTIWFTGTEIMVKADLFARFGAAEGSPGYLYQNMWFPYLLSNDSNWIPYINNGESESRNRTHQYNNKVPDGESQFNPSSWYTERDTLGSINVYAETFKKNSADITKGIVIYNDGYDDPPESDLIGFSFNQLGITAGTNYSVTVWMIFSSDTSSARSRELEDDIVSPVSITLKSAEKWVNQSLGDTDSLGLYYYNWSSGNQSAGWYSAVVQTNKSYYYYGSDYSLFELTSDETPPNIYLVSPGGWINYNNVSFEFFVYDINLEIDNCSLILNNQLNKTNKSISNNENNTITVYNMPQGRYNWSINCTDSEGNTGNSSTNTIYIDIIKPSINLSVPANGQNFTINTTEFYFTATDNMDSNISCNLTLDGIIVKTINAANGSVTNITISDIVQGNHTWNITCTDNAGNTNTTETRRFTTNLAGATIELISPKPPNIWFSNKNITFIYLPSSVSTILNCTLILDNNINKSNYTISNNNNNNFTITGIQQGTHNWNVNCTDFSLRTTNSTTITFYIDLTEPTIILDVPEPGADLNIDSVDLNFTVTDNMDTSLSCNLTLDGKINNTSPITADNGTRKQYSISAIQDGIHFWNVTCHDNADNVNTSLTYNFTVGSPPSVSLIAPSDGLWNNSDNITFFYFVTDNANLANCSLIFNGTYNKTNETPVLNRANNDINITLIMEGHYYWSINCTDTGGNTGNSSSRILYVDLTNPFVILNEPGNENFVTNTTIQFNFTATDNMDDVLLCNLTLDGVVDLANANIPAFNGIKKSHLVYDVSDGAHTWSVLCWDNAGNKFSTGSWSFNIIIPPIITLIAPPDGMWNNTQNITFYYNVTDGSDLGNCSIIFDGKVNTTNQTRIINGAVNSFTVNNTIQGNHTWSVNCTDLTNTQGNSSQRTLHLDWTYPKITLNSPGDTTLNKSTVNFNFTASDNIDNELQCNITLDGKINNTFLIPATNGTATNYTIGGLLDGLHWWNVTCWDNASNKNTSATNNFTVGRPPVITLLSPPANQWNNTRNISFFFNVTDNSGLANCSLILDNKFNKTNDSVIIKNGYNKINITNLIEGKHNWSINCTDIYANTGKSGEWIFYIDVTGPSIVLYNPFDGYISSISSVQFNFTVTDNMDDIIVCNLSINSIINNSAPLMIRNGTNMSYNVSGFRDGLFFWNITCSDNVTNKNTSLTWNFTIAEPPTVSLGSPANSYRTKNNNVTFFFTPFDNSGLIANCTVVFDNILNKTNKTITEGIENNYTINSLPDGKYNWTVNCSDPSDNIGTNASGRFLYIDTTGPRIPLHHPALGQTFNTNDVTFNWTPVDNVGINLTCNLTIDNKVNVSGITTTNATLTTISVENFTLGTHYWNVSCWDILNNSNISETRWFTVNSPDLTINISEFSFNKTNPAEGENVTINATVYNIGGISANNFVIKFYDGIPQNGGTQISNNITIDSLDSGANISVNVTWIAALGSHHIWILIDPNNSISELNETNNNFSKTINISSWQTVYGQSGGDLRIENFLNMSIYNWHVANATSGNIFAADLDSSITWNNITAIGIDTGGAAQPDDFEEIDIALGSTNYSDSVNSTFTINKAPRNKTIFTIFRETIPDVPSINSTNSSNFMTGILWDSSDGGTEFNASQDLIFATRINSLKQGKYGIYDFEITFPSELKKYITADQYSVALYVELR